LSFNSAISFYDVHVCLFMFVYVCFLCLFAFVWVMKWKFCLCLFVSFYSCLFVSIHVSFYSCLFYFQQFACMAVCLSDFVVKRIKFSFVMLFECCFW